jgi:hypothetical protein
VGGLSNAAHSHSYAKPLQSSWQLVEDEDETAACRIFLTDTQRQSLLVFFIIGYPHTPSAAVVVFSL